MSSFITSIPLAKVPGSTVRELRRDFFSGCMQMEKDGFRAVRSQSRHINGDDVHGKGTLSTVSKQEGVVCFLPAWS